MTGSGLDLLYLHLLSRYPTQEEFKTFDRYRKTFAQNSATGSGPMSLGIWRIPKILLL
ncbi:MAG: hypothetical protein V8T87_04710 [Victivallales bacterium]